MASQQEICGYLKRNTYENLFDTQTMSEFLRETNEFFLIGEELSGDELDFGAKSGARYFPVFFAEIYSAQFIDQITPPCCFKTGYLEIDQNGSISVTNNKFKPYFSSTIFYFDENKLKTKTDCAIAKKESFNSMCVKGALSFGLFAVSGVMVYVIADMNSLISP